MLMKEIYLGVDTSVLYDFREDPAYAKAFTDLVISNRFIVLIPDSTAVEFCCRQDQQESNDASKWLGTFLSNTNFRVRLGLDWKSLVRKESQGSFENPKFCPRDRFEKLLHSLSNPKLDQEAAQHLFKWKNYFYKKDTQLVKEAQKLSLSSDAETIIAVKERFEKYRGTTPKNLLLLNIEKYLGVSPTTVLLNPIRYRTAYLNAILFEYYAYGLLVSGDIKAKSSDPVYKWSGKERNTHEDHRIFSECSYCDYFLTEDRTLYKRCFELRSKNLFQLNLLKPLNETAI